MNLVFLLQQTLNGLSFGALLFLLASGFTLVFGLMRIVNLAHGGFYLLGGYVGVVTMATTGNIALAVLVSVLVVAVFGLGIERFLLRRLRGQELPEVLLTVGILFVIADLCLAIFGGDPLSLKVPAFLEGSFAVNGFNYPKYRIVVVLLAVVVGIGLWAMQRFTRTGAIVRAGVDDREIAGAMGINIRAVFTGMFVFGAALAALAGTAGSGIISLRPGVENDVLLYALVVVIIGGLGSIKGAAVGSVLIGLIDAFSKAWLPDFSYFTIFAPMALILVLRPTGLFGRAA